MIINLRMIRDGLNGMVDMRWHITWLQHFYKQFLEGIWYPRWLAGTNYGYGSPTFVFYPPLVYYLGSLLRLRDLGIENTLIILYSLALFLSGFNCYLFCQNRYGKIPGLLGAFAYMSAPYIAYNLYWVSSLSVAFAIAWIPLCWWLTDKSLAFPQWQIGITIFWLVLALTHLPTLLLCGIVWSFYILFLLTNYSWKKIVSIIFFAGIGLGTASFFLLPAILEQKYVDIASMKGVIGDIKNAIFGIGLPFIPSKLDFQVSHILFHQSLVILIFAAINFLFLRSQKNVWRSSIFWLLFSAALFLMMSSVSLPIWEASSILQKIQAPWRLFSVFSFGGAALLASTTVGIYRLRFRAKLLLSLIIIVVLVFNLSYGYKLSRKFPTFNNPGKANLQHLESSRIALEDPYSEKLLDVGEYRPAINPGQPSPPPIIGQAKISLISGQADIKIERWQSYQRDFNINVTQEATIKIRTYYYPAWHLYVNNQPYDIEQYEDGTIAFNLNPGNYNVNLRYQKTQAFIWGILISFFSLIVLIVSSLFI
ncbi:MAG: hypothetical protein QNJ70_08415 [Xenococcaceae cyanobacterium MO_207.B15]|nr:hypothetical protein [Xenococcaceae cyanobacterium MO_207.B15]